MDGASFDRLSMIVHRLRDRASRRGALRLLLGGSVAAATGLLVDDTDAKRRNRRNRNRNCRGYGGWCNGHNDCCSGRCLNNRCFPGGGRRRGTRSCGGRTCAAGWSCCNNAGVSVCVPNNYPICCGGNSFVAGYHCCSGNGGACPAGWDCCGGFNQCCGPNQFCCGNGQCCPDEPGWSCGDIACNYSQPQESDVAAQSADGTDAGDSVPFSEPQTVDPNHWITLPA